jgi:hypothetical protein
VPRPKVKRQSLALRLASVAAAIWRQHRHIERLGMIPVLTVHQRVALASDHALSSRDRLR